MQNNKPNGEEQTSNVKELVIARTDDGDAMRHDESDPADSASKADL
jgi:hypothetical protein